MTAPMMTLADLAEKGQDVDVLRQMVQFMAQRLMEIDVEGRCGAGYDDCQWLPCSGFNGRAALRCLHGIRLAAVRLSQKPSARCLASPPLEGTLQCPPVGKPLVRRDRAERLPRKQGRQDGFTPEVIRQPRVTRAMRRQTAAQRSLRQVQPTCNLPHVRDFTRRGRQVAPDTFDQLVPRFRFRQSIFDLRMDVRRDVKVIFRDRLSQQL